MSKIIINLNIEKRKMKLLALAVVGTASAQLESGCAEGLTWGSFSDDACTVAVDTFDELLAMPADLSGCSNPLTNAAANALSSAADSASDAIEDLTADDEAPADDAEPADANRRLQDDLLDSLSEGLGDLGDALGDAFDGLLLSVRLQCGD